jgi:2-polyprenyl-6-hydroxyphenyl methylase/3-demethylubiquinone-9 3-methyltransferase
MRGAFDAAVSLDVIEHLYLPRELAKKAMELLRPGGTLVLSTPYHGYLKNLALAVTGRLDKHFTALRDHGHIKFFSTSTLAALLAEAGFEEVAFSYRGRFPFLWKSMVVRATKPAERA